MHALLQIFNNACRKHFQLIYSAAALKAGREGLAMKLPKAHALYHQHLTTINEVFDIGFLQSREVLSLNDINIYD